MKTFVTGSALIASLLLCSQVLADDNSEVTGSTPMAASQHQAMKECMAKQKANNTSNLSTDEMKKACTQDIQRKQQKDLSSGNQGTPPK